MFYQTIVIVLISSWIISCKDNANTRRPALTNDELLELLNCELFDVSVPGDVRPDQFAGLAIRFSDGSITPLSSSNNWKAGETVKFVCFRPEGNVFKYAFFKESSNGNGLTTKFPDTKNRVANPKRSGLQAGEYLVRYSKDDSIVLVGPLEDDDFEIVFQVHQKRPNRH